LINPAERDRNYTNCIEDFLGSVARSQPAFTATSAQNHGHLATFHGHKIVKYGYIHGHYTRQITLFKGHEIFDPLLIYSTNPI
jgi:hypothetical protein